MKRFFDFVVSASALFCLLPILLLVFVLVRLFLGSPAFFRQTRPGLHGKPFLMVKFRTMLDANDKHGNPLPDDQRLTRFGAFLRATSLDELPELWNVFKGDMSLVGPRPLLMEYLPLYSPEQMRRHDARPGITGWAQVNGRNALSWDEKFKLDVWYVDHQSLLLDFKILFLTVKKVALREGISAEGEATMSRFTGGALMSIRKAMYGVYGASGFGREVMPLARRQLSRLGVLESDLVFIDDGELPKKINGHNVVTYLEFMSIVAEERYVVVAISDSRIRERLFVKMAADGVMPWSVKSDFSEILDFVEMGEGAILCNNVTLTSNIKVGVSFHANLNAYVGHDCKIGDYVTFAPSVCCNGNVIIEDRVYVGTGAIIKQGTPSDPLILGAGSIIGMGAVVTKSVGPGIVVVGNPAKPLAAK